MSSLFKYLLLLFLLIPAVPLHAQEIGNIINAYAKVEAINYNNNSILVNTTEGFLDCDKLLLIQMKGASIDITDSPSFGSILDYGSAGNYEFNNIDSIAGNSIFLKVPIERIYDPAQSVQIVRVPIYQLPVIIHEGLTCKSWDGNTGGVLVFESKSSVKLSANIDVSGRGFNAYGLVPADDGCTATSYFYNFNSGKGAHKGEGIFDLPNNISLGRGANANGGGGGNMHNSGGGGGGNFGRGGNGGFEWNFCADDNNPNGGIGAWELEYSNTENRIFMGGAGGTGHSNNEVGAIGGAGAGIIIIKAEEIIGGGGSINARGLDVATADNDGGGGGGAGGTILLDLSFSSGANIPVNLNGGKGGHVNWIDCHGPGGGGGGGLFWLSGNEILDIFTINNEAGLGGLVVDNSAPCYNENYGATDGEVGGTLNQLELVISGDPHPELSIDATTTLCIGETITFSAIDPGLPFQWSGPNNFQSTELNNNISNVNFQDEGVYTFSVTINECTQIEESVYIEVLGDPYTDLGADTTLCAGLPVTLNAAAYLSNYEWQDGSTDSIFEVSESGIYQVFISNGCGSWIDEIEVTFLDDCLDYCPLYSPNAMSPNFDGINDGFRQMTPCFIDDYSLKIFNRWGEQVFESVDIGETWDGRFKGTMVKQGVYVWVARGEFVDDYEVAHSIEETGLLVVLY